jgi:hypothetical protein
VEFDDEMRDVEPLKTCYLVKHEHERVVGQSIGERWRGPLEFESTWVDSWKAPV